MTLHDGRGRGDGGTQGTAIEQAKGDAETGCGREQRRIARLAGVAGKGHERFDWHGRFFETLLDQRYDLFRIGLATRTNAGQDLRRGPGNGLHSALPHGDVFAPLLQHEARCRLPLGL